MKDIIDNLLEESTEVHIEDILIASQGWFKFSPEIGVGVVNYINSTSIKKDEFLFRIRKNMQLDRIEIKSLAVENGKIDIDANY